MPEPKTSTYHSTSGHAHFATRNQAINAAGDFAELLMGDAVDATPGVEPDDRQSIVLTWNLAESNMDPSSDAAYEKDAALNNSSLLFTPSRTTAEPVNDNSTFAFAMLAPDGHWDRPTTHPLHTNQSGKCYSAPAISATIRARANNSGLTGNVADTMSDQTGAVAFTTNTGAYPYYQTFGTTMRIPANEEIDSVDIQLSRPTGSSPAANPGIQLKLYSLAGNARHYAPDILQATSNAVPYLDLTQSASAAATPERFTFPTQIPAQSSERWVAVILEGPWFQETYRVTHPVTVLQRTSIVQDAYMSGTDGSFIFATTRGINQKDNGFWPYYNWHTDVPGLYPQASTTPLTTPYQRHFGTPISNASSGGWFTSVALSYGDSGHTHDVVGWNEMLQAYLDSDNFDPSQGKTWVGMIIEVTNPTNLLWGMSGSQAVLVNTNTVAPTLALYSILFLPSGDGSLFAIGEVINVALSDGSTFRTTVLGVISQPSNDLLYLDDSLPQDVDTGASVEGSHYIWAGDEPTLGLTWHHPHASARAIARNQLRVGAPGASVKARVVSRRPEASGRVRAPQSNARGRE